MNLSSNVATNGTCPVSASTRSSTAFFKAPDQCTGQVPPYPHTHNPRYNLRSKSKNVVSNYNLRPRKSLSLVKKAICSGKQNNISRIKIPFNKLPPNMKECSISVEDIMSSMSRTSLSHFTKSNSLNLRCSVNLSDCSVEMLSDKRFSEFRSFSNDTDDDNCISVYNDSHTSNNENRDNNNNKNNENSNNDNGNNSSRMPNNNSNNSGGDENDPDDNDDNNQDFVDDTVDDNGGDDDAAAVTIEKCGHGLCNFCDVFDTSSTFTSSVTHRSYSVLNFQQPTDSVPCPKITCRSVNVIYLITCLSCFLQYVGETIAQINKRTSQHMSHISRTDTDQIFVQHFSSGACKGAKVSVQVIEEWDGNGRIDNDPQKKLCPSVAALRRKKETEWMLRLRTIYPYGLNMKVTDKSNMDKLDAVEGTIKGILFPPLPRSSVRPPLAP